MLKTKNIGANELGELALSLHIKKNNGASKSFFANANVQLDKTVGKYLAQHKTTKNFNLSATRLLHVKSDIASLNWPCMSCPTQAKGHNTERRIGFDEEIDFNKEHRMQSLKK